MRVTPVSNKRTATPVQTASLPSRLCWRTVGGQAWLRPVDRRERMRPIRPRIMATTAGRAHLLRGSWVALLVSVAFFVHDIAMVGNAHSMAMMPLTASAGDAEQAGSPYALTRATHSTPPVPDTGCTIARAARPPFTDDAGPVPVAAKGPQALPLARWPRACLRRSPAGPTLPPEVRRALLEVFLM